MRSLIVFSCLLSLPLLAQAQPSSLDKVFVLGEAEQRYEQLTSSYSQTLLEASQGDIEQAFTNWLEMQKAMDAYADEIDFDIKGVRVWLHVFWSETGKIDFIGFLPRPDSRLIDNDELRAFLAGFAERYQLPLNSTRKFNHYTGAAFPTLAERAVD